MKHKAVAALLILLCMILLLGVTGCMKSESIADKMVAYMNDEYSDQFEYVAPFGGGPGFTTKQIIVKSVQFPDARIWVEYAKVDGKEIYADNYLDYKYEDKTRNLLQTLLEEAFEGQIKLQYGIATKGTGNNFTDDTTFAEYIATINAHIGFKAFVSNEIPQRMNEEIESNLKATITENNIVAFGTIYLTSKAEQFERSFELSPRELDQLLSIRFSMDTPGSFIRFDWRDGQ